MKIDITQPPPADIFRDRPKHARISSVLLFLAMSGVLLMIYGVASDAPSSETMETVALSLLVGPAVVFVYFGTKLNSYKQLSASQKEHLIVISLKHPEIATYCKLVARQGREMTHGEYEACRDWAEDAGHKKAQAEK